MTKDQMLPSWRKSRSRYGALYLLFKTIPHKNYTHTS